VQRQAVLPVNIVTLVPLMETVLVSGLVRLPPDRMTVPLVPGSRLDSVESYFDPSASDSLVNPLG